MSIRLSALVLLVSVTTGIVAQEPPAKIKMHDAGCIEGDEAPWLFGCTTSVDLLEPLPVTVHILVETVGGTATPGVDYSPVSQVLEFKPGETWKTVTVVSRGDNIDEEDVLTVLLRATQEGVVRANATMTFYDNDPTPTLDVSDEEAPEKNGQIAFNFRFNHKPKLPVTIDYATADGTATAGQDYVPKSGKLVIPAGTLIQEFVVQVKDDTYAELHETFALRLTNPGNVFLGRTSATGKIMNDDVEQSPPPPFVIATASRTEGDEGTRAVDFDVELMTPHTSPLTVTLQTTGNGSATAGVDYQPFSQAVTFPAGVTVVPAQATILCDTLEERDETFEIAVIEDGAVRATGLIRIVDDDANVQRISIGDIEVTETNSRTQAVFPVTLSAPSSEVVRVSYQTRPGTAATDEDFAKVIGQLKFSPGETSKTVTVEIIGDLVHEDQETFKVELFSASGAQIAKDAGTCTIVDDDGVRRRSARH